MTTLLGYLAMGAWCALCSFVCVRIALSRMYKNLNKQPLVTLPDIDEKQAAKAEKIGELIWHRRNLRYKYQAGEIQEENYLKDTAWIDEEIERLEQQQ